MTSEDLEFEWNTAKAKENLEKHGISFVTAAATFRNERLEPVSPMYLENKLLRSGSG